MLLQVVGQMTFGMPIDYLKSILLGGAGVGFLVGAMIGPRRTRPA